MRSSDHMMAYKIIWDFSTMSSSLSAVQNYKQLDCVHTDYRLWLLQNLLPNICQEDKKTCYDHLNSDILSQTESFHHLAICTNTFIVNIHIVDGGTHTLWESRVFPFCGRLNVIGNLRSSLFCEPEQKPA